MFEFDDDNFSEDEALENLYMFLDHPELKQDFKDNLRDEVSKKFLEIIQDYEESYVRVPNEFAKIVLPDLIKANFIQVKKLYDFSFVQITGEGIEFLNQL